MCYAMRISMHIAWKAHNVCMYVHRFGKHRLIFPRGKRVAADPPTLDFLQEEMRLYYVCTDPSCGHRWTD